MSNGIATASYVGQFKSGDNNNIIYAVTGFTALISDVKTKGRETDTYTNRWRQTRKERHRKKRYCTSCPAKNTS